MLDTLNFQFWLIQTVAMIFTALLIPRLQITNVFGAIGIVVALAFVNTHLWDAALFLKVPDSLTTQSLTLIACNGILFLALVKLLPGIQTQGLLPCLVAPLIFSLLTVGISRYAPLVDWAQLWKETTAFFQSVKLQVQK